MKKIFVLVLVTLLSILFAPSVVAAPPLDVHIEVNASITDLFTASDPFTATGPAVDNGLLCPTGVSTNLSSKTSGPPNGNFRILRIDKRFVCDDTSGSFDLRLNVRLDLTYGTTTARWHVIGGTGAYANLHGNGSLVGTPIVLWESIHDVYDGRLH